ncbi:hypothetical protein FOA52_015809 [Chlamydomonas sp. UWO 241]|nr:hypothetical protein FOA52_015809 [Chlamydomonas sp. UWO 241]
MAQGTGDGATGAGPSFPLTQTPEAEATGRGGFLSVDLLHYDTPDGFNEWTDIKGDTEKMVSHHIRTVTVQLTEVYHAFALAHALNRTLIMPRVQCWCIQNWFENPLCRLPGDLHTRFPLVCPADFLFDMNKLYSVEVQGVRVPIREYSFLDNPRRPRDAPLVVTVDAALTFSAQYSEAGHALKVPANADDADLAKALAPYQAKYARIHIAAPPSTVLRAIRSKAKRDAFDTVMKQLPVEWCCRPDVVVKAHSELPLRHQFEMLPSMTKPSEA